MYKYFIELLMIPQVVFVVIVEIFKLCFKPDTCIDSASILNMWQLQLHYKLCIDGWSWFSIFTGNIGLFWQIEELIIVSGTTYKPSSVAWSVTIS